MLRNALITLTILLVPALAAAQNSPPIADAGPDQSIFVDESTILEGSATDPNGNPIVDWLWTIEASPDGSHPYLSTDDVPSPIFRADVAGEYTLSLIASDGMDWSEPDFVTITVAEILPPVAVAGADVTSGPAPLTVQFDGSQSYDPQGGALVYRWDFGEGGDLSTEVSPIHTYQFSGTFVASLRVVDSLGQNDVDTVLIYVSTSTSPPTANPTATPNSGFAPLTVQFAANASDPDGDPLTYLWDFGDGATSTVADPTHTYVTAGTFTVWLTVSDGMTDVSASTVVIVDPALDLAVTAVRVHFRGPSSTIANISIAGEWSGNPPVPTDVVSMAADGVVLFSAPFADFSPVDDTPGLYEYRTMQLRVSLDVSTNEIRADRKSIDLAALDNSNGLDVQLWLGAASALDNVVLQEASGGKLVFELQ